MKLPGETDTLFNALRQSAKPKPVSAIEKLIQDGPDRDLCRINALAKGEGVDTAKVAVRPVLDELFDGTHRFWLRRLSQGIEESVGFAGKFHGTVELITVTVTLSLGKTESK